MNNLKHFIRSHSTKGNRTSIAAAKKAFISQGSIKKRILEFLRDRGSIGGTPYEFSDFTGDLISTVRRRFVDLWREGYIKHHPDDITRKNSHDCECLVWVIGKADLKPTRYAMMANEIIRLRNLLIRNGINPNKTVTLRKPKVKGK